jgi:NAD(P)-dependent dehydrogenase (short-subunit alcohol dehydrogenase family)
VPFGLTTQQLPLVRRGKSRMNPQSAERALVSGATSGIGRAIAVRLAERGAIVGLVGRNMAAAETIAAGIRANGGRAFVAQADVTDVEALGVAVRRFLREYGGIDTVVASAGIALTGSVTDMTVEDWNSVLATNVNGTFHLVRLTIPELLKTRGTFTAISSDAGVQGAPGLCGVLCVEARRQRLDQMPRA